MFLKSLMSVLLRKLLSLTNIQYMKVFIGSISSKITFSLCMSFVMDCKCCRAPQAVTMGEWAIPQPSKLKYSQMFNMHDNMRKGHLTGMEIKKMLKK